MGERYGRGAQRMTDKLGRGATTAADRREIYDAHGDGGNPNWNDAAEADDLPRRKSGKRGVGADLLIGAVAGVAATWFMDKVTTLAYEYESQEARERENSARGDQTAYEITAEKAAGLVGRDLTDEQAKTIGAGIHWALGASAGAFYGLLRNQLPSLGLGSGLAFGTAFWLAMDEAALTVLGVTPPPADFPWQTHARGLLGHLVLGGVVELAFDLSEAAGTRT